MISTEPTLEIDDIELFDEAPTPANGDPYVAVVMKTNDNGVAIRQEAITLGTGYESIDDIAWNLKEILTDPEHYGYDIDFIPDQAHIFGIAGAVNFSPNDDAYTIEIEGETYFVEADNELDAKYRAASQFKEDIGGPEVGIGVGELAHSASVTSTPPAKAES